MRRLKKKNKFLQDNDRKYQWKYFTTKNVASRPSVWIALKNYEAFMYYISIDYYVHLYR